MLAFARGPRFVETFHEFIRPMTMAVGIVESNPFEHCADAGALEGALSDYAGGLGLPYFSYLMMRAPHRVDVGAEPVLLTNYPDEWRHRYLGRFYQLYDPVVFLGARARLPFRWNSGKFLRPFKKSQKRVFHEAREFRIVSGYSIPVCGPEGDVGLFTVVGARDGDLLDAVRAQAPALQMTAVQMHDRIVTQVRGGKSAELPQLTARELECLAWTAEGLTTSDIADKVCLSDSAVNYHLGKAARKLGGSSRHHAAILAIRSGLI
jgi:DNA-binding CsgD family transcriptional regulator